MSRSDSVAAARSGYSPARRREWQRAHFARPAVCVSIGRKSTTAAPAGRECGRGGANQCWRHSRRARRGRRRARRCCGVSGVTVRFGGIVALDSVSFDVQAGQIVRPDRPQRRRQDHPVQLPVPAVPVPGRLDPVRGPLARRGAASRHRQPGHRTHIPEPRAVPHAHGAGERHARRPLPHPRWLSRLCAALAGRSPRGAGHGGARCRTDGAGRVDRVRAAPRRRSAVRRAEAGRAGARARQPPAPAAAGRAGRRPQPRGSRRADGRDPRHPRPPGRDGAAGRTPHEPGDAHLRQGGRAGLRQEDRRRHARARCSRIRR